MKAEALKNNRRTKEEIKGWNSKFDAHRLISMKNLRNVLNMTNNLSIETTLQKRGGVGGW